MITVENHTPSTITVTRLTDGLQKYELEISRDEIACIVDIGYSQIALVSQYGKVVITTFENLSTVVNFGKLDSKLKIERGNLILPVTLKEHK